MIKDGVLISESGSKWVQCCVNGEVIPRSNARKIGLSKGKWYYIKIGRSILEVPKAGPIPSFSGTEETRE